MTLGRRMAMLFKAKASTALDRAEDPRETLDYSYEKQLELLQQVRRGVADVATSRKRLSCRPSSWGPQRTGCSSRRPRRLPRGGRIWPGRR